MVLWDLFSAKWLSLTLTDEKSIVITKGIHTVKVTRIYIECSRLMLLPCFSHERSTREVFYQAARRRKDTLVTRRGVE